MCLRMFLLPLREPPTLTLSGPPPLTFALLLAYPLSRVRFFNIFTFSFSCQRLVLSFGFSWFFIPVCSRESCRELCSLKGQFYCAQRCGWRNQRILVSLTNVSVTVIARGWRVNFVVPFIDFSSMLSLHLFHFARFSWESKYIRSRKIYSMLVSLHCWIKKAPKRKFWFNREDSGRTAGVKIWFDLLMEHAFSWRLFQLQPG